MKRHRFTNSEREYVRGIVHNLSFQRWTSQEIADYLTEEKKIKLSRSAVSKIKNQVERKSEKWYIELKQTSYKYIALYKERLDSLFHYQNKLHQIIEGTKKPDIQLRAIHELHMIELSIFNLWKQLPQFDIADKPKEKEEKALDEIPPILDEVDLNGVAEIPEQDKRLWHAWLQCEFCNRYWQGEQLLNYHKKTTHQHDSITTTKHDYPVL